MTTSKSFCAIVKIQLAVIQFFNLIPFPEIIDICFFYLFLSISFFFLSIKYFILFKVSEKWV